MIRHYSGIPAADSSGYPNIIKRKEVGSGSHKQFKEMHPPGRPGFVRRLDSDGDGRVSKAEFDGPVQHFDRLDKNADGFLSEDEAPMGGPPPHHKRQR
jgi:hypothetical protein